MWLAFQRPPCDGPLLGLGAGSITDHVGSSRICEALARAEEDCFPFLLPDQESICLHLRTEVGAGDD